MPDSYQAAERQAIAADLRGNAEPRCPVCAARVDVREVPRNPRVPYVRRRVWVLCTGCGRTAALDV